MANGELREGKKDRKISDEHDTMTGRIATEITQYDTQ